MAFNSPSHSNKQYGRELYLFKQSWIRGTPQYKKRLLYPGYIPMCKHTECVNSNNINVMKYTYWLCEECEAIIPDTQENFQCAPSLHALTKQKKKRQSVATFTGYCLLVKAGVLSRVPQPSNPLSNSDSLSHKHSNKCIPHIKIKYD